MCSKGGVMDQKKFDSKNISAVKERNSPLLITVSAPLKVALELQPHPLKQHKIGAFMGIMFIFTICEWTNLGQTHHSA